MRFRSWLHLVAIGFLTGAISLSAAGSPLIDAVKKQDVQSVRALLKQKANVNATEADGFTALHWAAQRDNRSSSNCCLPRAPTRRLPRATRSRRSTWPPSTATRRSWSAC